MPINIYAIDSNRVSRISGKDRYSTSIEIGKKFVEDKKIDAVILASGEDYPDALTGAILSKKYNAPLVLVEYDTKTSMEQIEFIASRLKPEGKVYILGGDKIVNNNFMNYFRQIGFKNIERIGGLDRYDTNSQIVEKAEIKEGTPVILTSSKSFADALSMSTISASKGYPILLTEKEHITVSAMSQIKKIKPKEIFIAGGVGALSSNIENQIKDEIPQIKDGNIIRLEGKDRYETSMEILRYFKSDLSDEKLYLASGRSFPDALSGTALAAKTDAPILLTNSQSIVDNKLELDKFEKVTALGGIFSIDEYSEKRLNNEKDFLFRLNSSYEKDGKRYVNGNFNKFSDNISEVKAYCDFYKIESHIVEQEGKDPYITDGGQDIPVSANVNVEVSNSVEVEVIDWNKLEGNVMETRKITFENLMKNQGWSGKSIFKVNIKDNKIVRIQQEYRP